MSETGTRSDRNENIDILRAVGIVIMVMGHVWFGGKFDRYIHSFHMPIFFIISGFLYKAKNDIPVYTLYIKKAQRLIVPYVFYACVNYLYWLIFTRDISVPYYQPLVEFAFYNTETHHSTGGAIWFLTALFWTEILYILIDRLSKKNWIRIILIVVISGSFMVLQSIYKIVFPWAFGSGMVCLLFYETGRLIKEYGNNCLTNLKDIKTMYRLFIMTGLLLINAVLSFVNPYVNVKSGWYGIIPVFYVNAVIGSLGWFIFADMLGRIKGKAEIIKNALIFTGSTTMIFLGINQLFIDVLQRCMGCPTDNSVVSWKNGVILLLTLAFLYIVSKIVKKINSKILSLLCGI